MKKLSILLIGLSVAACSVCEQERHPNRVDSILTVLNDPGTSSVLVVAHRGDWKHSVENSLPAIQNAIDMRVDVVEIDVRRTADGRLVLMHDATIDRTTNGQGKVAELTLDSIKKCRLKALDGSFTECQVPTLDEVFELSREKIMLNIDKGYAIFDEVYALADSMGVTRQIIMKGTQPVERVMEDFGPYLGEVIYMPIVNLDREGTAEAIAGFQEGIRPLAYELLFKNDTSTLPLKIKEELAGKTLIWYNSMWNGMSGSRYDDRAETQPDEVYGSLIDTLGATIIQTDRPGPLIEYLESRGQH